MVSRHSRFHDAGHPARQPDSGLVSERALPDESLRSEFLTGWRRWQHDRLAALNAPDGPPTLGATYWLDETESVPGVAGSWRERAGEVVVTLAPGVRAQVGGAPRAGEILALAAGQEAGPTIQFSTLSVQVTTRLGRRGVRIFEHARANSVCAVESFEPSLDWVIEGSFTPLPRHSTLRYSYALESAPRAVEIPGVVVVDLSGQMYETKPFLDEGVLLLVFSDKTTGRTSKPPSRFLTFAPPGGETDRPGRVTLDFNRAFLPPCAFSDLFNCPLPPAEHRFDVAVTAGETWAHSGVPAGREPRG